METRWRQEKSIEFVAVGHIAVDYHQGRPGLGGAAAYACLTASRLGLVSATVTAVGEDFDLFDRLRNIEMHYHREGTSTSFENVYAGGQRQQRLLGRARSLAAADLDAVRSRLADDAIVLYCPIARELQTPLRPLAARGLCGVAPQGFFRRWEADGTVRRSGWDEAGRALRKTDVVSLSEADPPEPSRFVREFTGRILAVTEGEGGARVYAEGQGYHFPAYPTGTVDPTGAGDVFAASFLVALRQGRGIVEAAAFACCAASFVVERPGVEGVPPHGAAVEERLAAYRRRFQPKGIPR